jgi:hypothetical protein
MAPLARYNQRLATTTFLHLGPSALEIWAFEEKRSSFGIAITHFHTAVARLHQVQTLGE